jgi:hypothetical protein
LFAAWDAATPSLSGVDTDGSNVTNVKVMAEALACVQLALRLIDNANATGKGLHSFTSQLNLSAFYGIGAV